ncbi:MAG: hypothetical protein HOI23_21525 [Deltaproteobacteria bacterium]|nr:hypothetical protein [Deltaproteobacteria bacterium]
MNRLKKNFLIVNLPLFLALAACATTKPTGPVPEVELYGDEKPTQQVTLTELATSYGWELQNPTAVGASVSAIRWKFKMGEHIQEGEITDAGTTAAGGTATGKLEVSAPMTPEPSTGGTPTVLRYRMQATFVIESAAGSEEMNLNWVGELLAPRQPGVTAMAGAGRYSSGTWELTVNIDLTNPNSFEMNIEDFSYQLFLDETELEGGQLVTNRKIGSGATMQFDVGRILKRATHKAVLDQIQGRPKVPFRLNAALTVQGEKLSIPVYGNLEFN